MYDKSITIVTASATIPVNWEVINQSTTHYLNIVTWVYDV